MIISYIIVSYNTSYLTQNTVASILNNCSNSEIIVVDNNSADSTVEDLTKRFDKELLEKKLNIVASKENNGFSKGNNIGASLAHGDFFVVINPDTIVLSDIGKELLMIAETKYKDKHLILSPQIVNPNMTNQHCLNSFPFLKIGTLFKRIIKKIKIKHSHRLIKTDWITGVCLCMRRSTFNALSGWNEKYDLYSEDLDICYRLKKMLKGQVVAATDYKLIHYGNQSGGQVFKSSYSSYEKKMNSLRIFFNIYYSDKKFIRLMKFYKLINKNENASKYYNELNKKGEV